MKFFDDLLDSFSAKELRTRVTGVIIGGLIVCIAAAAGLYFLLTSQQQIAVSGMGSFSRETPGAIEVSIPAEDLRLIEDRDELRAVFDDPSRGPVELTAKVISINPAAPSILIEVPGLPEGFSSLSGFDVRIILVEQPMWKMLWGGR